MPLVLPMTLWKFDWIFFMIYASTLIVVVVCLYSMFCKFLEKWQHILGWVFLMANVLFQFGNNGWKVIFRIGVSSEQKVKDILIAVNLDTL